MAAGAFDLPTALAAASTRPHQILGRDGGRLAPGSVADLTLFDPACRWQANAETLHSSGLNSPYLNQTLTGRVVATLVGGQWAYRNSSPV